MVQRFASKGWWSTNSREVFQGKTREAGQQLFRPPPILLKRVNRLIGSCLFAISYVLFCVELGLTFVFPQKFFSTQQCANSFILHRVQFCEYLCLKKRLCGEEETTNVAKWKSGKAANHIDLHVSTEQWASWSSRERRCGSTRHGDPFL